MKQLTPAHTFTYNGSTFNVYLANAGEGLPKHEHTFNHLTMCNSGSCAVRKANRELVVDKYTQPIDLVANEWHEIEALEDGTVFVNVFAEN
jgi:hypothetical protein